MKVIARLTRNTIQNFEGTYGPEIKKTYITSQRVCGLVVFILHCCEINLQKSFPLAKLTLLSPLHNNSPPTVPPALATIIFLSVSMNWTIVATSYKPSQAVFVIL